MRISTATSVFPDHGVVLDSDHALSLMRLANAPDLIPALPAATDESALGALVLYDRAWIPHSYRSQLIDRPILANEDLCRCIPMNHSDRAWTRLREDEDGFDHAETMVMSPELRRNTRSVTDELTDLLETHGAIDDLGFWKKRISGSLGLWAPFIESRLKNKSPQFANVNSDELIFPRDRGLVDILQHERGALDDLIDDRATSLADELKADIKDLRTQDLYYD